MFKLIVVAFISLAIVYYADIIIRIGRDEKEGKFRYKGFKLIIPFAYWFFPHREKKSKRKKKINNNPKTKKNEAK